jgi:hypothetical protein
MDAALERVRDMTKPWYVLCINRLRDRDRILGFYGPFDELDDALEIMKGRCFLLGRMVWVFGIFTEDNGRLLRITPHYWERDEAERLGFVTSPIYAPNT